MEDEHVKLDFDQSSIFYAIRSYTPDKHKYGKNLTYEDVKENVLQNPKLKSLVAEISSELNIEKKDIDSKVEEILNEIGHLQTIYAVRTLAMLIRGPLSQVLNGVFINKNGLESLRAAVEAYPVVILPSHRSYLDFLLVSYFMFEFNIQLPAIAAGQDFMNMKFISPLLKRSGAFFMRRSFGSDQLYKLLFTLYVQTVLCSCDTPIEFFIEGTRSRTAKCLHPKLGLLSMVVESYLHGYIPDIKFFPISISYERTLEETLFARELLGIPKPKESTSGLLKARSILTSNYGNIYINISSPISLHEFCQQMNISRIPHGLQPKHEFVLSSQEREMVTRLGYLILDKINLGMRVFPTSLIAAVLLQNDEKCIEKNRLINWVVILKNELENRGAIVHWNKSANVEDSLTLLISGETIALSSNGLINVAINNKIKSSTISSPTLEDIIKLSLSSNDLNDIYNISYVYLKLAHYRNQLLHWFLSESMLLMCLQGQPELTKDVLMDRFHTLCKALNKEFVLPQKPSHILFNETMQSLIDRGILGFTHNSVYIESNERLEVLAGFLSRLVQPFLAGVWVMCLYLVTLNGGVQTLKLTYKYTQLLGAKLIHSGIVSYYEILSFDMIKNAISSLNVAGLIMEPELEFEGRDRLVKVSHLNELKKLTDDIGIILFGEWSKLPISVNTSKAKL